MADQPITSVAGDLGSSGANTLLRFLEARFVRAGRNRGNPLRFVTDVSGALASRGNIVGVPVAPNVTSRTLTDGAARVLDNTMPTTVNVTLNTQRYYTFSLTTVAQALEGRVSDAILLDAAITGVLNGIEEDVMSLATSSFTTNAAVGSYNTALTEAVMVQAITALWGQKFPAGEPVTAMIHSGNTSWGALVKLANFAQSRGSANPYFTLGQDVPGNGIQWHGANYFMSQSMPVSGTSTDNLMFARSAIALAMRMPEMPSTGAARALNVVDPESGLAFQILQQWDGTRWANEVAIRMIYGYAIVKNAYGIQIKS